MLHSPSNELRRGKRFLIALGAVVPVVVVAWIWLFSAPDEVSVLAQQLQSGDGTERYKAAKDLEELGANATAAVNELAAALSDPELKVRYRSAKALSKMGPPAAPATMALSEALFDPERDVRYYAAKALYKIGEDAEPALEIVLQVVTTGEPDADVRRYLVKSLGKIGEDHQRAHEVVAKLARDRDSAVREEVAEVLEDFED